MTRARWIEFFVDDTTGQGSMNRLCTFIALCALTIILFCLMVESTIVSGADLREYLSALTTIGIIIAGLGGFNYAAGRAAGAYTDVRVAQAEKGIQPVFPTPPLGPTTVMNIGARPGVLEKKSIGSRIRKRVKR